MPVFSFCCKVCNTHEKSIQKDKILICKTCGREMKREVGKFPELKITEKRDSLKNKNITVNIEEITQKRSKDYFMEHEVDNAIQKCINEYGEEEGLNMAKRFGWVDKETGKVKRKIDLK